MNDVGMKQVKVNSSQLINESIILALFTFETGFFYICSFLAEGENLNLFPYDPENALDIYDAEFGCRWCSGGSLKQMKNNLIPVAIQINKPIEYKRYGGENV